MNCTGNHDDHCCYIGVYGIEGTSLCPFLEENTVEGRRWACGLMRQYGSWDMVLDSFKYNKYVKPFYDEKFPGESCATWPPPGKHCRVCMENE